jgi:hypothetical protein
MQKEEIAREVAETEIEKWLEVKKIHKSTRESYKDNIDLLIESIMRGDLTYEPKENGFIHKLCHPLDNGEVTTIDTLTYKGRLNDKMLNPYTKGIAATDGFARLDAIICALTGQARGIINSLDSIDKKIAMAIAVFFI